MALLLTPLARREEDCQEEGENCLCHKCEPHLTGFDEPLPDGLETTPPVLAQVANDPPWEINGSALEHWEQFGDRAAWSVPFQSTVGVLTLTASAVLDTVVTDVEAWDAGGVWMQVGDKYIWAGMFLSHFIMGITDQLPVSIDPSLIQNTPAFGTYLPTTAYRILPIVPESGHEISLRVVPSCGSRVQISAEWNGAVLSMNASVEVAPRWFDEVNEEDPYYDMGIFAPDTTAGGVLIESPCCEGGFQATYNVNYSFTGSTTTLQVQGNLEYDEGLNAWQGLIETTAFCPDEGTIGPIVEQWTMSCVSDVMQLSISGLPPFFGQFFGPGPFTVDTDDCSLADEFPLTVNPSIQPACMSESYPPITLTGVGGQVSVPRKFDTASFAACGTLPDDCPEPEVLDEDDPIVINNTPTAPGFCFGWPDPTLVGVIPPDPGVEEQITNALVYARQRRTATYWILTGLRPSSAGLADMAGSALLSCCTPNATAPSLVNDETPFADCWDSTIASISDSTLVRWGGCSGPMSSLRSCCGLISYISGPMTLFSNVNPAYSEIAPGRWVGQETCFDETSGVCIYGGKITAECVSNPGQLCFVLSLGDKRFTGRLVNSEVFPVVTQIGENSWEVTWTIHIEIVFPAIEKHSLQPTAAPCGKVFQNTRLGVYEAAGLLREEWLAPSASYKIASQWQIVSTPTKAAYDGPFTLTKTAEYYNSIIGEPGTAGYTLPGGITLQTYGGSQWPPV